MILLAISGGPDSMFLLNSFKKRNKKILVLHVNYHFRKDSNNDQKIVEQFCKNNNINFIVKDIKEKAKGNKESWARKERYSFFKKIYDEQNAKALFVAHHKDDFLETALMQFSSGRMPKYYGIKKRTTIFGMNVIRPFIDKYWKKDILKKIEKAKIPFAIDSTNFDTSLTRNKIRLKIEKWDLNKKEYYFKWFTNTNKILVEKEKTILKNFAQWKKSNFSVKKFCSFKMYKRELIFKFIYHFDNNAKLSKGKMENLVAFIEAKNNFKKQFIVNKKFLIEKDKNIRAILKK